MTPTLRPRRPSSSLPLPVTRTAGLWEGRFSALTTGLLAIVLIAGPLVLGGARFWVILPLLGVVALLALVQGSRFILATGSRSRMDAVDFAVALFLLDAVVRGLTSPFGYFSRVEAMEVAGCAVVFWSCRYGMTNRSHCMTLLYFIAALGVSETALGYYLSNHSEWLPFGSAEHVRYAPHWVGTYGSPNAYACFLVMTIGVALALGSFSKLAWPVRIVLFYLALMMIVGVIYSGSKGGWVALLASIGALVAIGIRNGSLRWWVPVTAALALIGLSESLFSFSQITEARMGEAQELLLGSAQADLRVQMTREGLRFAREHLVWGAGAGAFSSLHAGKLGSSFAIGTDLPPDDYLNCLDEFGVIGLGIALFFVVAITLKFFRPLVVDNRWQDRVLVAAGFAAWVALVVYSLLDFNLHIPANALLFFALTGLGIGRIKDEVEKHWSTVSLAPWTRWMGWCVVLLGLLLAFEVVVTPLIP